jgi:hypothetical protein
VTCVEGRLRSGLVRDKAERKGGWKAAYLDLLVLDARGSCRAVPDEPREGLEQENNPSTKQPQCGYLEATIVLHEYKNMHGIVQPDCC